MIIKPPAKIGVLIVGKRYGGKVPSKDISIAQHPIPSDKIISYLFG